jgi:hypothetical protein
MVVDKLSSKLRDYQVNGGQQHEDPFSYMLEQPDIDGDGAPSHVVTATLSTLSSHLLGPLIMEYENALRQMERENRQMSAEVQRQAEDIRAVVRENEDLAQRLEIQQREYLKIVEETRDNADILAFKGSQGGGGAFKEPGSP